MLTNQNTSSKLFKCVDQSGDYIYCKPYPCIDKAVSLYYYTASWHILTRMNKTIYKHAVSHNISMKCDKKYDSKKKTKLGRIVFIYWWQLTKIMVFLNQFCKNNRYCHLTWVIFYICYPTLKRIAKWPPSFCYILGKVFGAKYK